MLRGLWGKEKVEKGTELIDHALNYTVGASPSRSSPSPSFFLFFGLAEEEEKEEEGEKDLRLSAAIATNCYF